MLSPALIASHKSQVGFVPYSSVRGCYPQRVHADAGLLPQGVVMPGADEMGITGSSSLSWVRLAHDLWAVHLHRHSLNLQDSLPACYLKQVPSVAFCRATIPWSRRGGRVCRPSTPPSSRWAIACAVSCCSACQPSAEKPCSSQDESCHTRSDQTLLAASPQRSCPDRPSAFARSLGCCVGPVSAEDQLGLT